jgi:serine beta-lactamase-like protein LACTB
VFETNGEIMLLSRKVWVSATLSACLLGSACAVEPDVDACQLDQAALSDAIARSEAWVDGYFSLVETIAGGEHHGTSVAVSACGQIVWQAGFGFSDIEAQAPVTIESLFRAGSVAKTLTSPLLVQAEARGELDLDADIRTYFPDFPQKEHEFSTRQLAGHLAGIRHYAGDEFASNVAFDTVSDGLVLFEDDPLEFEPGTQYSYSSYGWNLLSAVVEGAAGRDYLEMMQSDVFDPAGMDSTFAEGRADTPGGQVTYYSYDQQNQAMVVAPPVNNSVKWASGGFVSTPTDLLRFGLSMEDGTLVSPEAYATLRETLHTSDGEATNYGLGWAIDMMPRQLRGTGQVYSEEDVARTAAIFDGMTSYGHTGGSMGSTTVFVTVRDEDRVFTVAAMSNSGIGPAYAVSVLGEFVAASDEARAEE